VFTFLPVRIRTFSLSVLLGLLASLPALAQTVFASGAGITAYDASTGLTRNFNGGEGFLTVSPDGARLYASTIFGLNVIDTATGQIIANIAAGIRPQDYAISPDGKRLYIANFGDQTLYVADAVTNTIIKSLPVTAPLRIAVSPDNSRVYVSTTSGGVLIFDPATDTVKGAIPGTASGSAFGPFFGGVTFSVDSQRAYIAFSNGFWIVDAQKDTLLKNVIIPGATGVIQQIVPTIDGTRLYAAADRTSSTQGPQAIYVLDASTLSVTTQIQIGECSPQIALSADGTKLFVSDIDAAVLDIIDVNTNTITASVPIGGPGSISGVATLPPPPAQAKRLSVPASLDFGSIVQGGTVNGSLALANTGPLPLTITAISSDNAAFSIADPAAVPITIQSNATATVGLVFEPSRPGPYSGVLSISVDGLTSLAKVNLTGTAFAPPTLIVQPQSLDFGKTSTAETRKLDIRITNPGGSTLIGSASIISATPGGFALPNAANFSVEQGNSVILTIGFTPQDRAVYSGVLNISSNGGALALPLSGIGEQVAVLTVVGFGGDFTTFGLMPDILTDENKRLRVFSFVSNAGPGSNGSPASCLPKDAPIIERIAGELSDCINDIISQGFDRVDVVAHSMGGLETRAFIAGLATDIESNPIPYSGQIRKLIMVGTPNYGVPKADPIIFAPLGRLLGRVANNDQVKELTSGSDFLMLLDRTWRQVVVPENRMDPSNMLMIVGTAGLDGDLFTGVPDDEAVPNASATLPCEFVPCTADARNDHVRYVPYKHTGFLPPSDVPAEVEVDSADHQTLKLVRDFLLDLPLEITFAIPPLSYTADGLILLRFVDAQTGDTIEGLNHTTVLIDGRNPSQTLLGVFLTTDTKTGSLTLWPAFKGDRLIEVHLSSNRFSDPEPFLVQVTGGRPIVRIVPVQRR
jgi:YVTN family beta-propeller protein